jgi:hypothetical protein
MSAIETLFDAAAQASARTGMALGINPIGGLVQVICIDPATRRCDPLTEWIKPHEALAIVEQLQATQLILVCGPMGEAIWEVAIPPHRLRDEWLTTPGEMVAKREDDELGWTDSDGGPVTHPRVLAMIARLN